MQEHIFPRNDDARAPEPRPQGRNPIHLLEEPFPDGDQRLLITPRESNHDDDAHESAGDQNDASREEQERVIRESLRCSRNLRIHDSLTSQSTTTKLLSSNERMCSMRDPSS